MRHKSGIFSGFYAFGQRYGLGEREPECECECERGLKGSGLSTRSDKIKNNFIAAL